MHAKGEQRVEESRERQQTGRCAVIAVHGVGKHEPGSSAQAIAGLLLGLNAYDAPPKSSPYSGFDTTKIDVPLPGPKVFFAPQSPPVSWFEERRGFFADKFRLRSWKKGSAKADLNDEFTLTQIGDYKGDALCGRYESVRLQGSRTRGNGQKVDVDIYEMYWADLAKRNNSFVRFFMSLYQLLIHLSSLGRTAIDQAALQHAGSLPWLLLQRSYSYATRVLTLGMFNFLILLPVVAFAPIILALYPPTSHPQTASAVAAIVLAVAAAGAVAAVLWNFRPRNGRGSAPFFLLFATISLGTGVGAFLLHQHLRKDSEFLSLTVLALAWWVIALAIVYFFIFKNYDEVRAGAKEFGLVCIAAVVLGFVACLWFAAVKYPGNIMEIYSAAGFLMVQYIFLVLRALWTVLFLLTLFSWTMEFICIRITPHSEERARARAAFRTGRFALAMPTVLLLLLTMFFWSGAFWYTRDQIALYQNKPEVLPQAPLPEFLKASVIRIEEIPALLLLGKEKAEKEWEKKHKTGEKEDAKAWEKEVEKDRKEEVDKAWNQCYQDTPKNCQELNRRQVSALLVQSAPMGLPLVLASLGIGFLLLLILAAPSAVQEATHPLAATNAVSRRLGGWLSGALSAFPAVVYCFWLAAFGLPAGYVAVATIHYWLNPTGSYMFHLYTWLFQESIVNLTLKSGPVIAAIVVFMATAGKAIFRSASTILDTVLDVDNYLRSSPADNTPRARIVERYAGLLHFLNEQGYEKIIIVAHSLGSLISADLLRFLHRNRIPSLTSYAFAGLPPEKISISLFTMGNPLRQLLNRFFPDLYEYIRPVPDDSGEAPQPQVPPGTIPKGAMPDPKDLGIQVWINFYRSGDYVGRSLWLDHWMERTQNGDQAGEFPGEPVADYFTDGAGQRVEACIGLGAHTHYWDRSAPDIGIIIDSLIK
ncbi:MAG TPA: hypothetical protein VGK22_07090 [Candidatus Angelobacter sp.]|jgi:hypothetical protein